MMNRNFEEYVPLKLYGSALVVMLTMLRSVFQSRTIAVSFCTPVMLRPRLSFQMTLYGWLEDSIPEAAKASHFWRTFCGFLWGHYAFSTSLCCLSTVKVRFCNFPIWQLSNLAKRSLLTPESLCSNVIHEYFIFLCTVQKEWK